jgi:hypothetical protein
MEDRDSESRAMDPMEAEPQSRSRPPHWKRPSAAQAERPLPVRIRVYGPGRG